MAGWFDAGIMKSQVRILPGLVLACQFLALPVMAAEAGNHKLSEWKLGKVLFGEKITKTELKGKVVVIENWGIHCAPCIASLPHLAELDQKNRDKGLRIIGAESQGGTKEQIKPLIEKAKVEYTIVAGAEGPIQISGIPHAFVFNTDGKLIYDGGPADPAFDKAIAGALGEANAAPATTASTATTATTATTSSAAGTLIPMRSWTNAEGREIRAAVKKATEMSATFQLADGREVTYQLDKLSADSRQVIVAALKAKQ